MRVESHQGWVFLPGGDAQDMLLSDGKRGGVTGVVDPTLWSYSGYKILRLW